MIRSSGLTKVTSRCSSRPCAWPLASPATSAVAVTGLRSGGDAVLGLALGAGPIGRTGPRPEPPVLGEGRQLVVEDDAARHRIMLNHQGPRIVEQHLLGHPAKLGEVALQADKPALLALIAERSHMQPPRIAERRDKQERLDLAAGDLDQALAKVDLELLARRRLKARRRPRLRRELPTIRLNRSLDRAQADDDALLGSQLLADHVRIAAMAGKALLKPAFLSAELLASRRLAVRPPAARLQVALHRVPADPKFPRNPPRAPAQLLQPQHRRNLIRLQHPFPPRFNEPQRACPESLLGHQKPPWTTTARGSIPPVVRGSILHVARQTK